MVLVRLVALVAVVVAAVSPARAACPGVFFGTYGRPGWCMLVLAWAYSLGNGNERGEGGSFLNGLVASHKCVCGGDMWVCGGFTTLPAGVHTNLPPPCMQALVAPPYLQITMLEMESFTRS